jgi:purine-nucleoside phosphorylase
MDVHTEARTTAARLHEAFGPAPKTAVILGSGLSGVAKALSPEDRRAPYADVGLPATGVSGHAGALITGTLGGARVALLAGRVHAYEGHPMARVVASTRAMAAWGVKELLVTSAVGGLDPGQPPGQLVRLVDHINLTSWNPLVGAPKGPAGVRFPDLSHAYDPVLGARLSAAAEKAGVSLPSAVYAAMSGPSYETPAEVRMLRRLGADVVGMSTVFEVIAAVDAGLRVTGLSVIANPAAGLSTAPLLHEDVTREVDAAAGRFTEVLRNFLAAGAQEA